MKSSLSQSGQALVLVLLSLAVVLTLVLYILSRSVTDIAVSTREEEAIRAFSAAEAGVERALIAGTIGNISGAFGDASFSAEVTSVSENGYSFNYPINLASGDTATIWFMSHDENGNLVCDATHPCFSGNSLNVCWGKLGTDTSGSETPALEVSVFYDDGTVKIARGAFDSYSGRGNNFSLPDSSNGSCVIDGVTYQFGKTVSLPPGELKFARVRMFYNITQNHEVGFSVPAVGDSLPSQGISVSSSGTSGDSGEANRRVEVFQGFPEIPPIFDSVIFSSGSLVK